MIIMTTLLGVSRSSDVPACSWMKVHTESDRHEHVGVNRGHRDNLYLLVHDDGHLHVLFRLLVIHARLQA